MPALTIDKRTNLSRKEFINEYVMPRKPVVITDAIKNWKAYGKFTPEFFKKNYGNVVKEVNGVKIKMSDYVDMMLNSTEDNPAPYPYNINVGNVFPELLEDMKPQLYYGKIDRALHPLLPDSFLKGTEVHEFFFGGKGSSFPYLHYDALCMNTQITQLYGDKEFILYSPDQSPYMYPREDKPKISHVKNVLNPDYEKFPLFKNAQPSRVMVKEGETLFFPQGWWHVTIIHSACITYGRIQLNHDNWTNFINDNYSLWKTYHPSLAPLMKAYSTALGGVMTLQESLV